MTKQKDKIGFTLILLGFFSPLISVINFWLFKLSMTSYKMNCNEFNFSYKDISITTPMILVLAGVLILLPIGEWLEKWRGGKRK